MFPSRRIILQEPPFWDNKSIDFNSSNTYCDCGNQSSLQIGDNDTTYVAWIYPSSTASADKSTYICAKRNDSAGALSLFINSAGKMRPYIGTTRQSTYGQTDISAYGAWVQYALTYNNSAGETIVYLDGRPDDGGVAGGSTDTSLSGSWSNDAPFVIGARDNSEAGYQNWTGANISELVVYAACLSPSEIKNIYNEREAYNYKEGIKSSSLRGWWRMGEGRIDDIAGSKTGYDILNNGIIGDELNPTFGSDLFDTGAGSFASDTGAWTVLGNNEVALDSNTLKVTYVDNAGGAKLFLKDAADLTEDLESGRLYVLDYKVKCNDTGTSVLVKVDRGDGSGRSQRIESATFVDKRIYFIAKHATDAALTFSGLGTGDIVHLDNVVLRAVNGNAAEAGNFSQGDVESGADTE